MKKLLTTAAVLALTAGAAHAADLEPGFYIGAGAGASYLSEMDFKSAIGKDKARYDVGPVGSLQAGYNWRGHFAPNSRWAWLGNWRTEVEGQYHYNDVDKVKGIGSSGGGGHFESYNVMLNQIYDFNNNTRFTPYLGVGVGAIWQDAHHIGNVYAPGTNIKKDDVSDFAYQGIAGVEYSLTPKLGLGLRYNYLGALQGDRFRTNTGVKVKDDYLGDHTLQVTMRYSFGEAKAPMAAPMAAAPMPVAQPMPTTYAVPTEAMIEASPYKIFFANDSAQLNDAGRQVVSNAADAVKSQHAGIIQLTSNTDTTGSKKLNDNLSERRAKAVRQALIAQGVSPSMIKIVSNAERDLPVPTGKNVREPRNRVVTIVLQ